MRYWRWQLSVGLNMPELPKESDAGTKERQLYCCRKACRKQFDTGDSEAYSAELYRTDFSYGYAGYRNNADGS